MRAGIVAAVLLLVPVTAGAQEDGAQEDGDNYDPVWDSSQPSYAGLRGSLAFGTAGTTIPSAPPTRLRGSSDNSAGGSIYIGTQLPLGLRVELEVLYRYLPLNSVNLGGTRIAADGQANVTAPMVNLFWDLPVDGLPFQPFLGGGIGVGDVFSGKVSDESGNIYFQPHGWKFAYALMAGGQIPLGDGSRLTAMYRWLKVNGVKGKCGISGAPTLICRGDLTSQGVDLGLEMDM
jgi:opacity protein-like surface antigen